MSGVNSKPSIGEPGEPTFLRNVKTMLEILTGRRNNRIARLFPKLLSSAGAAPTQAEYNALAAQVVALQDKVNELLARFDS